MPQGAKGSPLPITIGSEPDGPAGEEIETRLAEDIAARFRPAGARRVVLAARSGDALVGGLTGVVHWGWLYIRQVWVSPGARGAGTGTSLIQNAVAQARATGCAGLYVDTFEERTARLYERCGFRRVGRIADFPPGHARVFLALSLPAVDTRP